ncbi:hypothetical protein KEM55_000723 [Ascosphaera atra]|nr:hypothetical protein KEM55_000723 [Ascosphaera atra]
MANAWSLDFCMVCDKQTLGGPYCSQTCRLAEMDRCSDSEPSSPRAQTPDLTESTWAPTFYSTAAPAVPSTSSGMSSSQRPASPPVSTWVTPKRLSSCSSQTSLSSVQSVASQAISSEAQSELDHYSGLFDKVRVRKSRLPYLRR